MTSTPDHISRMNRRSFLHRAFCGEVVILGTARPGPHALSSAGKRISTIGLQLYTVRRELETDSPAHSRKLRLWAFVKSSSRVIFKYSPREVKSILAHYQLSSPSAHISTAALRGNLQEEIEAAQAIGHQCLVCGYLPAEERRSLDDYKRLVELLNRAGERLKKVGIQFAYHNHDFEFAALEG